MAHLTVGGMFIGVSFFVVYVLITSMQPIDQWGSIALIGIILFWLLPALVGLDLKQAISRSETSKNVANHQFHGPKPICVHHRYKMRMLISGKAKLQSKVPC